MISIGTVLVFALSRNTAALQGTSGGRTPTANGGTTAPDISSYKGLEVIKSAGTKEETATVLGRFRGGTAQRLHRGGSGGYDLGVPVEGKEGYWTLAWPVTL